jgi:glycosyltransferase involved in cell wall biosynthesis
MISILMPIYNEIEFIDESVKSILNQTFNKWELIIGINGHNKNSEVFYIAKKYEEQDTEKRIKVLDLYTIKGKSNTLNELIKYCSYDYIALLDVDDIWMHNKLEIQSKLLNIYDVIGSNCVYFGNLEGIIPSIPEGEVLNYNIQYCNPIINSSAIIHKSLCYWNSIYDGVEDYDLWIRLYKSGHKFYNFKEVLVKHRIHKSSAFNATGNHLKVNNLLKEHGY